MPIHKKNSSFNREFNQRYSQLEKYEITIQVWLNYQLIYRRKYYAFSIARLMFKKHKTYIKNFYCYPNIKTY